MRYYAGAEEMRKKIKLILECTYSSQNVASLKENMRLIYLFW